MIIGTALLSTPEARDSVGIETINGKTFIIHKVEEKETLFAISRRYRTTVDLIVQHNTTAAAGLEIGQLLRIPYSPRPAAPKDAVVHTVGPKETLFSIARQYAVPLDDLKKWNNLADNALTIGQEIIIRKKAASVVPVSNQNRQRGPLDKNTHTVAEKETMYSIARQYGISVDELKSWNKLESNELKIGQTLVVSSVTTPPARPANPVQETARKTPVNQGPEEKRETTPSNTAPKEQTIRISETVKNTDEIMETGVAELIEGTEGNRKYLALHRSAPVGTILKVKNEMNNREVFVRVMGKLPDTAMTDKVIIRVSKSAYDRLGAIDPRFRVEVTYYK